MFYIRSKEADRQFKYLLVKRATKFNKNVDKNVSNVSIMILVMVHDQKRGEYYSRHFINYCYAHRAVYEIISLPDHFAFLCKEDGSIRH